MKLAKWLYVALAAVALALLASLVATRALAPRPGPVPSSGTEPFSSNLLSGTVTGLDRGDSVRLLLEGPAEGPGEIVRRLDVVDGRWRRADLALPPGYYRLLPEAEGYIHVPHSITFQIPEKSIVWRYLALDFRFYHPADAVALLGLPLCPDPSSPIVPVTAVPEGTPSPTTQPESTLPGPCYANHLADVQLVPAGLQGHISGLTEDQVVTLSLYALPPVPDEQYGQGEPPAEGSGIYPPEVSQLAAPPDIAPDWPSVATLRAGNGPWGLVDPSLVGGKYLVVAHAVSETVDPPAYEVVIFAGKAPGFPGGVDFACGP